jgi:hypothetical protein
MKRAVRADCKRKEKIAEIFQPFFHARYVARAKKCVAVMLHKINSQTDQRCNGVGGVMNVNPKSSGGREWREIEF